MKHKLFLSLVGVAAAGCGGAFDVAQTSQAVLGPPRHLAPLSTATVTAQAPVLRWFPAVGSVATRLQVCADRACAAVEQTWVSAGSSSAVPVALSPGVHYWRAAGQEVTGAFGPYTPVVWQFRVRHTNTPVQSSWGTDPDFNGDGRSELAVGRSDALSGQGLVSVFAGSAGGAMIPGAVLSGSGVGASHFGEEVSSVGDVNGDGFADLGVGASNEGLNGAVRIHQGGPGGAALTSTWVVAGPAGAGTSFGTRIRAAGDVNHDGYGDFVVGAGDALHANPMGDGTAYVFLGGAAGPSATPAYTYTNPLGLNGAEGFGRALASADVNGDGNPDLMIGAPLMRAYVGNGQVMVYMASASGLPLSPTFVYSPSSQYFFGSGLAAGDPNGDGYADLAVARHFDAPDAGSVRIYHGSASGLNTALVGNAYLFENAALNGIWMDGWFGWSLSFGSDVNADGYEDLVVGAPNGQTAYGPPMLNHQGRFHVYHGAPGGMVNVPATLVWGSATGEKMGSAVAGLSDLNGDGFGDLAVGSPGTNPAVRVYSGGGSGVTLLQTLPGPVGQNIGGSLTAR